MQLWGVVTRAFGTLQADLSGPSGESLGASLWPLAGPRRRSEGDAFCGTGFGLGRPFEGSAGEKLANKANRNQNFAGSTHIFVTYVPSTWVLPSKILIHSTFVVAPLHSLGYSEKAKFQGGCVYRRGEGLMSTRKLVALKFGVIVLLLGSVCAASAAPWGPTKLPPPRIAVLAPWGPTKLPPPPQVA